MTSFHRRLTQTRTAAQAASTYCKTHAVRKLQLGAGTNILDGWFNTDLEPSSPEVAYLDATAPFPFAESTFHYIFSEHHIEHISYRDGCDMLRECYRVLVPGGTLRVATPSLETLLRLYTAHPNELQQHYIRFMTDAFVPEAPGYQAAFVINNAFRNWGHQFLYDEATLRDALSTAGFRDIVTTPVGESDDVHLRGIDTHGNFIGDEVISRFETMVFTAVRPLNEHIRPEVQDDIP